MKLKLLAILALLILPTLAKADTPSVVEDNPTVIDYIWDGFHKLPNLKEGAMWDMRHKRVLNTLSIELANAGYFGEFWKNITLNGSYIGTDGIGGGIDFNLSALPVESVPVLKYLEYGYVGYGCGLRTITGDTNSNPGSDNQGIQGIRFGAKLNF